MVKTSAHKTQKQLGVENDDLRARLAEAEENLRAIGSNGRDVLSVSSAGGVLQQSELRYRRLFEAAQDGILILDAETGMIDDVNPYLIKMLGYSREEFIRRRLWEVGAFKDIEASQEAFEALQVNEYIRYEDLPLRAKDGRLIEVEFVSNVYLVDDKKVIQCNIRDITARKQSEAALLHSEKRFSALFENMLSGFAYCRILFEQGRPSDFIYLEVNRAFETLVGLKNVVGKKVSEVIPGIHTSNPELLELYSQVALTGIPTTFETYVEALKMWFSISVYSPQKEYFVAVFDVITERKQAEESLRENEERFRQVWENTSDAMALSDSGGILVAANPAYFDLFGYTSEQALGVSFALIFPEENRVEAVEQYKIVFASDVIPPAYEVAIRRADGTERIIETRMTFLTVAGRRTAILSTTRDITERRRTEEKIQRQLEHLTALSTIDQIITAIFDLRLSLSEILNHVTLELGVDAADILILTPNTQILEYVAEHGFRTQAIKHSATRFGQSYAGRVALERQLIHIPNLRDDSEALSLQTIAAREDFVCYYGVPLIAKGQVRGVLEVWHRAAMEPDSDWLDFLNTLAGQTAIAIENATLFESLQRANSELAIAYDATIEGWSRALDLRDKETEGHSLRVTELTVKLARSFGFNEADLVQVRWGALLHDIGKMGVPDEILLKPGPLTDEEWVAMKKHPDFAYEMLVPIRYLRLALDIPYCHHEKWDGTGYPRGLKGEQIPLAARLFAVVDVWDALSSDRPYRPAWPNEKVRQYTQQQAGFHFDPQVVEAFLRLAE